MNQDADHATARRSASRDGLAAVAIILLALALIILVVSALV
jgi:hypothetical protein